MFTGAAVSTEGRFVLSKAEVGETPTVRYTYYLIWPTLPNVCMCVCCCVTYAQVCSRVLVQLATLSTYTTQNTEQPTAHLQWTTHDDSVRVRKQIGVPTAVEGGDDVLCSM